MFTDKLRNSHFALFSIMSYFCTCNFAGFIVIEKKYIIFNLFFLTDRPESLGLKKVQSFSLTIMTLWWRSFVLKLEPSELPTSEVLYTKTTLQTLDMCMLITIKKMIPPLNDVFM